MIVELSVENIVLIERATLAPGQTLTALTGETGAGKSLLVDAIELAFGARADSDLVRTGADRASVNVVLDLSSKKHVEPELEGMGIHLDDNHLYLSREVHASGKSTCRINGKMVPLNQLRQVGRFVIDLHGQHAHQSLLRADEHLGFLDQAIGGELETPLRDIREALDGYQSAKKRLAHLRSSSRERELRIDMLRFQVQEIEEFGLQPNESLTLPADIHRMKHAEKLSQSLDSALHYLKEMDGSALDSLGLARAEAAQAARIDESLDSVRGLLDTSTFALEDVAASLAEARQGIESDPALLVELEERLDGLKRLMRKYGETEQEVLEHLASAAKELQDLESSEGSEESAMAALSAAELRLKSACEAASDIRKRHARTFAQAVESELHDLSMPQARFEISFADCEPNELGADQVEFLMTSNPGEPMRPIQKIASGGELSRIMLAIKTANTAQLGVPTLIFDEIDAGLGGKAAAVVGRKLAELAKRLQIIVITHSPQIASQADRHIQIEKHESGGRMITRLRTLDDDARIEEVARMIGGESISESALQHAKEMLCLR